MNTNNTNAKHTVSEWKQWDAWGIEAQKHTKGERMEAAQLDASDFDSQESDGHALRLALSIKYGLDSSDIAKLHL